MTRLIKLPVLVALLTAAAVAAVTALEQRSDASRRAQLKVASLGQVMGDLQAAPFNADPRAGGSPKWSRRTIDHDERILLSGLDNVGTLRISRGATRTARENLRDVERVVATIYRQAVAPGGLYTSRRSLAPLQRALTAHAGVLSGVLAQSARANATVALRTQRAAAVGTAAAMLALVTVFLFFYVRSMRARRENERLLALSRIDASTDPLTGLGNRRAFTEALDVQLSLEDPQDELLLMLFDLDGFKRYNDSFGHADGDDLLAELGQRLARAVAPGGSAFRMGGDEFCVIARCPSMRAEQARRAAADALSETRHGWCIAPSCGSVWIPSEAEDATSALRTADERMYADKASRLASIEVPKPRVAAG